MVIYAFASVLVCWGVWGYEMGFGAQMIPGLVGIPRPILSSHTELKQVSMLACPVALPVEAQSGHPGCVLDNAEFLIWWPTGSNSVRQCHGQISLGHHGLLPVCLRCNYGRSSRRCGPCTHELPRMDAFLPPLADFLLYRR